MKIPEKYYEIILNEFKDVEKLAKEATNIDDKLYFFSASFGVINRVMNFHYDPLLVFIHQVLQTTHQSLLQRFSAPKIPGSISNIVPDEMINSLFKNFSQLISEFEKKEDQKIREVLQKFSILSYATTGNGYYLYLKEKLII